MACMERGQFYGERQRMEEKLLVLDTPASLRPQSRISSVNIRDFGDETANPEPIQRDEETDLLMEEFLSPTKLRLLTGETDLEKVTFLDMKVDTSENSLGNFGSMVPNLLQLKLNNSTISTVRDLGTSLHNLRTLWMARCGLTDLDGIGSLTSVTELYLAFNNIVDVSPLSMLDNLKVLDLEGNLVDDISQVEFLCLCTSLKRLTLEGNPVCFAPHPCQPGEVPEDYDYQSAIHKAIPNLRFLDDELLLIEKVDGQNVLRERPQQYKANKVPQHLKTDSQLICESIKEIVQPPPDEPSATPNTARPKSATQRPSSSRGQRPSSSRGQRPDSSRMSFQRPSSACSQRPSTGNTDSSPPSSASSDISGIVDDSSDLTHGSGRVICGNISRALKERRKDMRSIKPATVPSPDEAAKEPNIRFIPEKSFEESSLDMKTREDVFDELKKWREEYSKILGSETNILRIPDDSPHADVDSSNSLFQEESNTESPVSHAVSSDPPQGLFTPSPPSSKHSSSRLPYGMSNSLFQEESNTESPVSHAVSSEPPQGFFTPSPPSSRHSSSRLPSGIRQPLPTPPLFSWGRPQTAADFKIRRFRQRSTEIPVEDIKRHSYHGDESYDVDKSPTISTPLPVTADQVTDVSEPRSFSAPVKATRTFRLMPEKTGLGLNSSQNKGARPSSQPSSQGARLLPRPITAASVQKRRPQLPK